MTMAVTQNRIREVSLQILRQVWKYSKWAARRHKVLLRATGLSLATVLDFSNVLHGTEKPKILIYESKLEILFNSAVHLLPATISSLLVAININGRFIGRELEGTSNTDDIKLSVLQIAAKMQELLVISSLASIVLHVVRRKLLYHEGIPLGLLGSHMCFTSLSYFWSLDFWGAIISYDRKRRYQNLWFFGLLVVSGFIAALAGPATAILMIPRTQNWDAGGMIFWMNGSDAQLWPTRLDAEYSRVYNCSTDDLRLIDYHCPSSIFTSIWPLLSTWANFPDNRFKITLDGYHIRKLVYVLVSPHRIKDTWAYTAHAPSASLQDGAVTAYFRASNHLLVNYAGQSPYPERLDLAQTKKCELETKIPAVRVACFQQNDIIFGAEALNLTFPVVNQFHWFREEGGKTVIDVNQTVLSNLSDRNLIIRNGSGAYLLLDRPNILGIPMSIDAGDASSLGLVFLKLNATNGVTPVACTVDARWEKGRTIIEDDITGQGLLYHNFEKDRVRNLINTELVSDDYGVTGSNYFHPSLKDASSWTHISISPAWFNFLSPSMPDTSIPLLGSDATGFAANRTLLERLMAFSTYPTTGLLPADINWQLPSMEVVISMMFADGLSHVGAHLQVNQSKLFPDYPNYDAKTMVRNGPPNQTFGMPDVLSGLPSQRMVMRAKFTGYAMSLTNWFDWFSAALLLLHAVIALVHTLHCLFIQHQTSEAWDTIPELLALAKQSPPETDILNNTSAGIRAMSTMGCVAVIELSDPSQHGAKERLQLNFKETWCGKRPGPEVNVEYGAASASHSA